MQQFQVELADTQLKPRYNIAPSQEIPIIRAHSDQGQRALAMLKWGLIPFWAKDPKLGSRLINARGETASTKPSFRQAFRQRRCLIPSDGYYEWKSLGSGRSKQPYLIQLQDDATFAFAGLWEQWKDADNHTVETCCIITTTANELTAAIHDRMPVILSPDDYTTWLHGEPVDVTELEGLMRPYPSSSMNMFPVSQLVNSPRNDTPSCVQPAKTLFD